MAINKKLIHFLKRESFDKELEAGNILETSICFIKDSQEIYTHEQFYDCKGLSEEEIDERIESYLYEDPTNGYGYVDMGEAGIWAKYPIGITEWNEDAVNKVKYFAWGEIDGYTKDQIGVDKQFTWDDYKFGGNNTEEQTKYNNKDGLTTLETEDDACSQNMGGNWRMPTTEEFQKLYNLCNTEWVTNYNGVSGLDGRLFTLKTDASKQLFFPAFGHCKDDSAIYVGSYGYFYSSSLIVSYTYFGFYLSFSSDYIFPNNGLDRYYGCPIVGILGSSEKSKKYLTKKEASEIYVTKEKLENINSDWDANEGEKGYIENRPFYEFIDESQFEEIINAKLMPPLPISLNNEISLIASGLITIGGVDPKLFENFVNRSKIVNKFKVLIDNKQHEGVLSVLTNGDIISYCIAPKVVNSFDEAEWYISVNNNNDTITVKYSSYVNNVIISSPQIVIKKIDDKFLPDVDWNSNEGESGFIHNRPFYEIPGISYTFDGFVYPNYKENYTLEDKLNIEKILKLLQGDKVKVQINDDIYTGVVTRLSNTVKIAYRLISAYEFTEGMGSDITWIVNISDSNISFEFYHNLLTVQSLKIILSDSIIKKIDPKFLPDDISGNADWNALEVQPGFIKNKPFGEISEIIFETDNGFEQSSGFYTKTNFTSLEQEQFSILLDLLKSNKDFIIEINGTKYEGTVIDELEGFYTISKPGTSLEDLLTPEWALGILSDTIMVILVIYNEPITSLKIYANKILKIDSKYLPDADYNADWNAYEEESGFIKNKPFGEVKEFVTILDSSLYILEQEGLKIGITDFLHTPQALENVECLITFNSESYIRKMKKCSGYYGDIYYMTSIDENEYLSLDLLMQAVYNLTEEWVFTISPADSQKYICSITSKQRVPHLNIKTKLTIIEQIDSKYLPIVQNAGPSTTHIMSQDAVTRELYGNYANGYECVDMGEAGIWAKYPIGVTEWSSESLNQIKYFAWGETEGYTKSQIEAGKSFNMLNYKWYDGGFTKYCNQSNYGKDGFTDDLTILLPEDDACVVNMKGCWRMPIKEEYNKLLELCNYEWVTNYNDSGIDGGLLKLKTDESKQLFLPSAGYYKNARNEVTSGFTTAGGYFSSSSLCTYRSDDHLLIIPYELSVNTYTDYSRYYGYTIIGLLDFSRSEKYLSKKEAKETYATKEELNNIPEELGGTNLLGRYFYTLFGARISKGNLTDQYDYLNTIGIKPPFQGMPVMSYLWLPELYKDMTFDKLDGFIPGPGKYTLSFWACGNRILFYFLLQNRILPFDQIVIKHNLTNAEKHEPDTVGDLLGKPYTTEKTELGDWKFYYITFEIPEVDWNNGDNFSIITGNSDAKEGDDLYNENIIPLIAGPKLEVGSIPTTFSKPIYDQFEAIDRDYYTKDEINSKLTSATSTKLGLVKSSSGENERIYDVEVDNTGVMKVNVPWATPFNNEGNIFTDSVSKDFQYLDKTTALGNFTISEYKNYIFDNYKAFILDNHRCAFTFNKTNKNVLNFDKFNGFSANAKVRFSIWVKLMNDDENFYITFGYTKNNAAKGSLFFKNKYLSKDKWQQYSYDVPINYIDWNNGDTYSIILFLNADNYSGNNRMIVTAPKLEVISGENSITSGDNANLIANYWFNGTSERKLKYDLGWFSAYLLEENVDLYTIDGLGLTPIINRHDNVVGSSNKPDYYEFTFSISMNYTSITEPMRFDNWHVVMYILHNLKVVSSGDDGIEIIPHFDNDIVNYGGFPVYKGKYNIKEDLDGEWSRYGISIKIPAKLWELLDNFSFVYGAYEGLTGNMESTRVLVAVPKLERGLKMTTYTPPTNASPINTSTATTTFNYDTTTTTKRSILGYIDNTNTSTSSTSSPSIYRNNYVWFRGSDGALGANHFVTPGGDSAYHLGIGGNADIKGNLSGVKLLTVNSIVYKDDYSQTQTLFSTTNGTVSNWNLRVRGNNIMNGADWIESYWYQGMGFLLLENAYKFIVELQSQGNYDFSEIKIPNTIESGCEIHLIVFATYNGTASSRITFPTTIKSYVPGGSDKSIDCYRNVEYIDVYPQGVISNTGRFAEINILILPGTNTKYCVLRAGR